MPTAYSCNVFGQTTTLDVTAGDNLDTLTDAELDVLSVGGLGIPKSVSMWATHASIARMLRTTGAINTALQHEAKAERYYRSFPAKWKW